MREAYRDVMDHIAVTEEMRSRILSNVQSMEIRPAKPGTPYTLRRWVAAAACLALIIAGAVVLPQWIAPVRDNTPSGVQSGIWNPVEAASAQELSQLVGFPVETLENLPFEVLETRYVAYGTTMAEVTYIGEAQELVFRQTTDREDPSGDYTVYADTVNLGWKDGSVTLKGEAGMYSLAVWQDETYSYSMRSSVPLAESVWSSVLP